MQMLMNNKGSALLIVIALIALLTGVSIMSVNRSTTDIDLSYNQQNEEKALYVAEAGIARAIVELNKDNSWRIGYFRDVIGGGDYTVQVFDSVKMPSLIDTVLVQTLGRVLSAKATVRGWVVPVAANPFQYALFGDAGVLLENLSCTDSYNSDSGDYISTQLNTGGDVGSNGTVELQDNTTIGGNAVSAMDSSGVIVGGGSTVTGTTSSGVDSVSMDLVSDSEYVWASLNNTAPGGLSGSDYNFNIGTKGLVVGEGGNLTLASGVYYFSSIKLEKDGELNIAAGAEVTIYLTGDFLMENAAKFNSGGSPSDVIIYSKGASFKLENDSEFYGAFYGPNADFKIENNTNLYGAIVANSIKLENNACFHYDRQLGNIKKGYTGEMELVAWRKM